MDNIDKPYRRPRDRLIEICEQFGITVTNIKTEDGVDRYEFSRGSELFGHRAFQTELETVADAIHEVNICAGFLQSAFIQTCVAEAKR